LVWGTPPVKGAYTAASCRLEVAVGEKAVADVGLLIKAR
jgi:hypothetical protein